MSDGSAFDIAGQVRADPAAVLRALHLIKNVRAETPQPVRTGVT
jgi:isocitrate/isopropylmalate dehydrogenase